MYYRMLSFFKLYILLFFISLDEIYPVMLEFILPVLHMTRAQEEMKSLTLSGSGSGVTGVNVDKGSRRVISISLFQSTLLRNSLSLSE